MKIKVSEARDSCRPKLVALLSSSPGSLSGDWRGVMGVALRDRGQLLDLLLCSNSFRG